MAKNTLVFNEYNNSQEQANNLAEQVANDIAHCLADKAQVVIAVPGGSTPGPFLKALSAKNIEWHRVIILLTDERWVPLSDAQSNEAMVRTALQSGYAKKAKVTGFYSENISASEGVEYFNREHSLLLSLDICVLGMGDDGHMASLFPGMGNLLTALDVAEPPSLFVAEVEGNEFSKTRVSLNFSSIVTATKHYVLIKGNDKKQVLEQASIKKNNQWPVSYLIDAATVNVFYTDHEAS